MMEYTFIIGEIFTWWNNTEDKYTFIIGEIFTFAMME